MFVMEYIKNVVSLELHGDRCIGCGICMAVCPRGVLHMENENKAGIGNRDACIECGACMMNCPVGALKVNRGVGCAAAVINNILGRKNASCCGIECGCEIDSGNLK